MRLGEEGSQVLGSGVGGSRKLYTCGAVWILVFGMRELLILVSVMVLCEVVCKITDFTFYVSTRFSRAILLSRAH